MTTTWLTFDDPRLPVWWPAAADMLTGDLQAVLEPARVQCEAFAPALPADTVGAPVNYLMAQAYQARALSRLGITGDNNGQSDLGPQVTLWPMDWAVKALLRPPGKPVVQ